jgi:hypothetical protein
MPSGYSIAKQKEGKSKERKNNYELSIPISTRNPGYKKFEHGIRGDFARGDCDPDIRNLQWFIERLS